MSFYTLNGTLKIWYVYLSFYIFFTHYLHILYLLFYLYSPTPHPSSFPTLRESSLFHSHPSALLTGAPAQATASCAAATIRSFLLLGSSSALPLLLKAFIVKRMHESDAAVRSCVREDDAAQVIESPARHLNMEVRRRKVQKKVLPWAKGNIYDRGLEPLTNRSNATRGTIRSGKIQPRERRVVSA